ncbi:MAG: DUF2735 domain-containing protein [Methylobacterium sp.]|uniref:DUF2735 domain-containing protein n=1 Tax=Methylobacterium sp. TaxID=409 RepID=UPI0025DF0A31|nr:DUF2735 domain-containing protein [Methylobacterium sp.]MBX9934339.1 DUF2735 domain-containing protein [Methylobacterium sp.]
MNTTSPRETATIYTFRPRSVTFPIGGKPGQMSAEERPATQVATCDFGSGWYHDAAIQDATVSRKS